MIENTKGLTKDKQSSPPSPCICDYVIYGWSLQANKEIWVLLEKNFSVTLLPILAARKRQTTLPSEINPSILAVLSNCHPLKNSIIFAGDYAIFEVNVLKLEDLNIIVLEKKEDISAELYGRIIYLRR